VRCDVHSLVVFESVLDPQLFTSKSQVELARTRMYEETDEQLLCELTHLPYITRAAFEVE
jgi:hypothetical protein